ncbi:unnamed protein product [Amoebophrya sp. A120]|nr:unnamed protein product [Amoebophrya sp. A120]|eukprot:GSA120T00017444001.1
MAATTACGRAKLRRASRPLCDTPLLSLEPRRVAPMNMMLKTRSTLKWLTPASGHHQRPTSFSSSSTSSSSAAAPLQRYMSSFSSKKRASPASAALQEEEGGRGAAPSVLASSAASSSSSAQTSAAAPSAASATSARNGGSTSSSSSSSSKYVRYGDEATFLKMIRKPPEFFSQVIEGLKHDFEQIGVIGEQTSTSSTYTTAVGTTLDFDVQRENIQQLLASKEQRDSYRRTIFTNVAFSKPVSANFAKSALALPTMGSSIYSHMFAGITEFSRQKLALEVENHADKLHTVPAFKVPTFYREKFNLATYYRTPILVEELDRLGFTPDQQYEALAKAFFLQYWSGDYPADPLIFNPLVRVFYPQGHHIISGSNDLGRETEFQAAKLYAQGIEGEANPGLTIVNFGDTGAFTDGAVHAFQHAIEAKERGLKMPLVFLVTANNSSISSRIALDDPHAAVKRIEDRFTSFGFAGRTTEAEDVAGGLAAIRACVEDTLETGRPSYCISSFPFRPLGHASDGHPGADPFLLYQFDTFKQTIFNQVVAAADKGTPGASLANELGQITDAIEKAVSSAMIGDKQLTNQQIFSLASSGGAGVSQDYDTDIDKGAVFDLPASYLLGKSSGGKGAKNAGFAGLGNEIYARALDRVMQNCEAESRTVRYVHQENHAPGTADTRGGVYGELNNVSEKFLKKNFHALLPNEAQVAQVGAGLRVSLPENNLVFVKGPHTIFNEHARDHLKYGAFRFYDSGEQANYIYIMDGGSLAVREREKVPASLSSEVTEMVDRDIILARVGEHHNTPEYSSYTGDANTTCALPLDMNLFEAMLPAMVNLHDQGRMVLCFAPTAAFGALHSKLPLQSVVDTSTPIGESDRGLGVEDVLRVSIAENVHDAQEAASTSAASKELVVVSWGPDVKWVAKSLSDHANELQARATSLYVLSYAAAPDALARELAGKAEKNANLEVLLVDPNPNSGILGPVAAALRRKVQKLSPTALDSMVFSECTPLPAFVPYGLGTALLNADHLQETLTQRGFLVHAGVGTSQERAPSRAMGYPSAAPTTSSTSSSSGSTSSSSSTTTSTSAEPEDVLAPIAAENAIIRFLKQVGDTVQADEAIAELETDKASIEIVSQVAGTIAEFHVKEMEEIDVTEITRVCTILPLDEVDNAEAAKPAALQPNLDQFRSVSSQLHAIPPAAALGNNKNASGDTSTNGKEVALSTMQKSMVRNMTVQPTDSLTFGMSETVDFVRFLDKAKQEAKVSPTTLLAKLFGDAIAATQLNRKLNTERTAFLDFSQTNSVDLGLAITVDNQLRVAVLRDVNQKSVAEIAADIAALKERGSKLTPQDQDLSNVCYVLTTLGKDAPVEVNPTLPRGMTAILGVGRTDAEKRAKFTMNVCHATLNGAEGATVLMELVQKVAAY